MPKAPELSVVLVVGELRARGAGALSSVLEQDLDEGLEVILVDLAAELPPVAGSDDPRVAILAVPSDTLFSHARARGTHAARGTFVAFIEEHARAAPGWARVVVDSFAEDDVAGVGTAMANANPGVGTSDIAGLVAYGYFYPPFPAADVEFLPGHNASYRRKRLLELEPRLAELMACDLVLQSELRHRGHRLRVAPGGTLFHLNETTAGSRLRGMIFWYRIYADLRARQGAWSRLRRLLYVAGTPLMPPYYLTHFSWFLARARPRYLGLFLRHLPYVAASVLAGGIGQAMGLLKGPGDAERRFTRFELTEPRAEAAHS
jgi:hypothetical protein